MNKVLEMKRELADQTKAMRTYIDGITAEPTEEQRTECDKMERSIDTMIEKISREERQIARELALPTPPAASARNQPGTIDAPAIIKIGRAHV